MVMSRGARRNRDRGEIREDTSEHGRDDCSRCWLVWWLLLAVFVSAMLDPWSSRSGAAAEPAHSEDGCDHLLDGTLPRESRSAPPSRVYPADRRTFAITLAMCPTGPLGDRFAREVVVALSPGDPAWRAAPGAIQVTPVSFASPGSREARWCQARAGGS